MPSDGDVGNSQNCNRVAMTAKAGLHDGNDGPHDGCGVATMAKAAPRRLWGGDDGSGGPTTAAG